MVYLKEGTHGLSKRGHSGFFYKRALWVSLKEGTLGFFKSGHSWFL